MERLSERGEGTDRGAVGARVPSRLIGKQIGRAHRTVWGYIRVLRRPSVAGAEAVAVAVVVGRARGDLAGSGCGRVVACDRCGGWVGRRRRCRVRCARNGGRRRYRACRADRGGVASGAATEAVEARVVSPAAGGGGGASSSCVGRRSRSRVGWWRASPTIRRCACRTRRSTCRCSCSPAARCARN